MLSGAYVKEGLVEGVIQPMEYGANLRILRLLDQLHLTQRGHRRLRRLARLGRSGGNGGGGDLGGRTRFALLLLLTALPKELLLRGLFRRPRLRGAQPRNPQVERDRRADDLHKLAEVEQLAIDGDNLVADLQLIRHRAFRIDLDDRIHLIDAKAQPPGLPPL